MSPFVLGSPGLGSPGFIAYRSNISPADTSIPRYRSWSAETNSWSSESSFATAGSPVRWVRVAYCPNASRKDERIVVTLSDDGSLYAYVGNGTTWSQTSIGSTGTTVNAYRAFDLAYETTTGRALVVYSKGTTPTEIGYRIWDGVSWASEVTWDVRTTDVVNWIVLASAPGARSGTADDNEIAMIYLDDDPDVHGYVWTGTAWNEPDTTIWDTTPAAATTEHIAVAYELTTGEAMFLWGDSANDVLNYRMWTGTLGATTTLTISDLFRAPAWVSLKSRPGADDLILAVICTGADLNTRFWTGTAWDATGHSEHDGGVDLPRGFDIEWESDGTHALLVYGTAANSLEWTKFDPATPMWLAGGTISATGSHPWVQLRRPPFPIRVDTGNAPQVMGGTLDTLFGIDALQFDGTSLTLTADAFTSGTVVSTYECFEIAFLEINPKISVDPASLIDTGTTYAPQTPVILNPNGNGYYSDWSGSYTDWDDWPSHDDDTTKVYTTQSWYYISSTLTNHGAETWNIAKVKLTVVARNTDPNSGEKITPFLRIDGSDLEGSQFTPTTTYENYTSEWAVNLASGLYWNWTAIDALEAGVYSEGSYGGELRVTQLYVEVTGPRLTFDIRVDYVKDLWLFNFELTFNPEVIKGVVYDPYVSAFDTRMDPIKRGPFLESAGGTASLSEGLGWNNTMGKLWLTGAFLGGADKNPAKCPDGTGVIATMYFEVVAKGETNIRFGELTELIDPNDNYLAQGRAYTEDGYFRNVDSALIPKLDFSVTQTGAWGIIEGKDVIFTGNQTGMDTYKWYFWKALQTSFYEWFPEVLLRPDGNGTYTDWTGYARDWDDTTADADATYVSATSHNLNETSTLADDTLSSWTIDGVVLRIVARNTLTSDEEVQLMLVVGGTKYLGEKYKPTTSYSTYTSEWSTNPATGSRWTWANINALKAGVRSEQVGGSWTGELRVTQLYLTVIGSPLLMNERIVTQNFTNRGTWPVTHTVISGGIVGTITKYVALPAHDIAVTGIYTNASASTYPIGSYYIDMGETIEINITVENQGGFSETFDLIANWSDPYQNEGSIGEYTVTLGIGVSENRTFTWTPTGARFNITHPDRFGITGNASIVQYEYDQGDNTFSYPYPRIRYHNVAVEEIEMFGYRAITPNGNGDYTAWTGTYTNWDDWPTNDTDTTTVNATSDAWAESSTLTDHGTETWTIAKVRLVIVARNLASGSNERILPMLVIGGTRYYHQASITPTISYEKYEVEWTTNPAYGGIAWNWTAIDALQAGVESEQVFGWTGILMVTQLYVEVLSAPVTSLTVQPGEEVLIKVTVENFGDFNQTNIAVTPYYDSTPAAATQIIPLLTNKSFAISMGALGMKSDETLDFIWDTTGVSGTYTINATAAFTVAYTPGDATPGDDYTPGDDSLLDGTVTVGAAVPEFPLGVALEMALAALVIYIWWRTKKKPKKYTPNRTLQLHHSQLSKT